MCIRDRPSTGQISTPLGTIKTGLLARFRTRWNLVECVRIEANGQEGTRKGETDFMARISAHGTLNETIPNTRKMRKLKHI